MLTHAGPPLVVIMAVGIYLLLPGDDVIAASQNQSTTGGLAHVGYCVVVVMAAGLVLWRSKKQQKRKEAELTQTLSSGSDEPDSSHSSLKGEVQLHLDRAAVQEEIERTIPQVDDERAPRQSIFTVDRIRISLNKLGQGLHLAISGAFVAFLAGASVVFVTVFLWSSGLLGFLTHSDTVTEVVGIRAFNPLAPADAKILLAALVLSPTLQLSLSLPPSLPLCLF